MVTKFNFLLVSIVLTHFFLFFVFKQEVFPFYFYKMLSLPTASYKVIFQFEAQYAGEAEPKPIRASSLKLNSDEYIAQSMFSVVERTKGKSHEEQLRKMHQIYNTIAPPDKKIEVLLLNEYLIEGEKGLSLRKIKTLQSAQN